MAKYTCPFCGSVLPDINETHQSLKAAFITRYNGHGFPLCDSDYTWEVNLWRCPSCFKVSSYATGDGALTSGRHVPIYPESAARQLPAYIPEALCRDYTEACLILRKSPKASATLARRCLQGMIRDFWKVTGKHSLNQEIDAIKDKVPAAQWTAIDGLRKIGNVGAHMEKDINLIVDVDPDEAEKLLQLIELLMDKWYIARHDEEALYQTIVGITAEKEAARHPD